jgi:hypothetical protein
MHADIYRKKLISLLRGLECKNVEDLAEKDAVDLFLLGSMMTIAIKQIIKKGNQND